MASKSTFTFAMGLSDGSEIDLQSDSSGYMAVQILQGASTTGLKLTAAEAAKLSRLLLYVVQVKQIDGQ